MSSDDDGVKLDFLSAYHNRERIEGATLAEVDLIDDGDTTRFKFDNGEEVICRGYHQPMIRVGYDGDD